MVRVGARAQIFLAVGAGQREGIAIGELVVHEERAQVDLPLHAVEGGAVRCGVRLAEESRAAGQEAAVGYVITNDGLTDLILVVEGDGARGYVAAEILVVVGASARGPYAQAAQPRETVVLRAVLEEQGAGTVVIFLVLTADPNTHLIVGRPFEEAGQGIRGLVADLLLRDRVGPLTVEVVAAHRQAASEDAGNQRSADAGAQVLFTVFSEQQSYVTAQFLRRGFGHEVDRPGVGVPSIERALRTLDDFHALEIVQVQALEVARVVDAVYEVGRTGFNAELHAGKYVTQPANHRALGGATERLGKAEAGREAGDVVDGLQAALLDGFSVDNCHGDRYFLETLFPATGGDHHFFQA